jgi:hypothetical protein
MAWGRIGHHIRPALPLENAVAAGTGLKEVDDISPPPADTFHRDTFFAGRPIKPKGLVLPSRVPTT